MFPWKKASRGIHLNIIFLILAIITPVILFIFYLSFTQLKKAEEAEINRLKSSAVLVSTEYSQIVEGVRQLLITLSISEQTVGPNCSSYLTGLLERYQRYSNISFANPSGDVLCSGVPLTKDVKVTDRLFFKSTISSKTFSVGEYSLGPVTNKPIITFGHPYLNAQGALLGVVYASIDLKWLGRLTQELEINTREEVLVLDWKGKALASYPDKVGLTGKIFPGSLNAGINKTIGFDGVEKIYVLEKIGTLKDGPLVAVGMTEADIHKGANDEFRKAILIAIIIGLFSIIIGYIIGSSIIKRIISEFDKIEELRRSFVTLASHQLRTPLTGIKYLSEILISESTGKLNVNQKEFVKDIQTSTQRLISMIGTLLNISKLELETPTLLIETVNISKIFNEERKSINMLLKRNKISFKFANKKSESIFVYADPKLIRQAVSILITNAAKYSDAESTVTVAILNKKNNSIVSVTNTGILIEQDELPHLFDKFFRGKGALKKNEEGSGLGLYLCKLIINVHKGNLVVSQKKNREITFTFSLPII